MEVNAIADELNGDSRVAQQRQHCTGFTMVRWAHSVEQVGCDSDSCVDCLNGLFIRGIRSGQARRQPHVGDGTNRREPASELWGEGDHLDAVADDFQQPFDIGVHQKFGVVGAATTLVEEWSFDVQSCEDPGFNQRSQPDRLRCQVRPRAQRRG